MSTVVRGPDGKIRLYCKGADTVILERLGPNQPYTDRTLSHLEVRGTTIPFARSYVCSAGIRHRWIANLMYRLP